MDQKNVLVEVKKAIDFWMDKTYNESEFYSHCMAIIRDGKTEQDDHREQLERLLFKTETLRSLQQQFHGGNKKLLGECKRMEAELDKRILFLKQSKGYNTDRFRKSVPVQNKIFN